MCSISGCVFRCIPDVESSDVVSTVITHSLFVAVKLVYRTLQIWHLISNTVCQIISIAADDIL